MLVGGGVSFFFFFFFNDTATTEIYTLSLHDALPIPAISAACWFAFFYTIYGTPDPRAPYGGSTQSDLANLGRGLTGLLFDQQFGMLPAAPVFLCALAGFVVLLRQSPSLAVALVLVTAPYGLVVG